MNYNKEKFLMILDKIMDSFESQNKMADVLDISSSYITKIYNENTKNPPAPEYLQKIANNSGGITTYQELMQICGYLSMPTKHGGINICILRIYMQSLHPLKNTYHFNSFE